MALTLLLSGAVSGLLTWCMSVYLILTHPGVGATDTAPDTSSVKSKISHKGFAPDTGNVGTADSGSGMLCARLKFSVTYSSSIRYNSSPYNSVPDTQSVGEDGLGHNLWDMAGVIQEGKSQVIPTMNPSLEAR
ncbi:hypothetical protein K438DRAFT_1779714 [Mycena galopus ATCC 62051]|nr:hypothetical protein K438DRAFT_1779714 [Mycena galopus ATCC 62051]